MMHMLGTFCTEFCTRKLILELSPLLEYTASRDCRCLLYCTQYRQWRYSTSTVQVLLYVYSTSTVNLTQYEYSTSKVTVRIPWPAVLFYHSLSSRLTVAVSESITLTSMRLRLCTVSRPVCVSVRVSCLRRGNRESLPSARHGFEWQDEINTIR